LSRCTPEEKRFLASLPFSDNYDASPSQCGSAPDSDDDPDYVSVHKDTEPGSDNAEMRPLSAAPAKPQPAKPHKWKPMVPRSFDGTECFTNWWNHIENVIEYNGWTEHETMLQLRNLLLGDAADVLWTRDRKPVRSFAVIARQLYLKYADTRRRELHLMELHSYRRRPGEDLIALHARTLRLIAMCHPEWRAKDRQQTGMYYFLDALDDELSSKVRDHLPDTLDKALEIAVRLEALHQTRRMKQASPSTTEAQTASTQQARKMLSVAEASSSDDDLELKIVNVLNRLLSKQDDKAAHKDTVRKGKQGGNGQRCCFNCGEAGHFKRNCPLPLQIGEYPKTWFSSI